MLNENLKAIRESKGLSQEDLAIRLNVVRQTVSKWERGLSVPDADMLIAASEVLETPVSDLLGGAPSIPRADDLQAIAQKLEVVNAQLARRALVRRRVLLCLFAAIAMLTVLVFSLFATMGGSYLAWDQGDPETAVAVAAIHAFEWVFVRIAPIALLGSVAGFCLTWRGAAA
ncbi:MAG: helix-turn-helix transcriptional regulator [Collinsella sp.]|nr:helix-turn-helix transcriptional regulator [Collinsella sp.]